MATNPPTPSGHNAGPRKAPAKKPMSIWAALGVLVGIGVGIYLVSWVISWIASSAVTALANGVYANFGLQATLVVLLAIVVVGAVLSRRK